ncbi:MAG: hypothetical protein ACE14L_17020 [Terriglobales bacterium]
MSKGQVFSQEELKALETPLADQIATAIDRGEYDKAKALAQQMEKEASVIIYTMEEFVTALLSYVYQTEGDAGTEKALRYSAGKVMKPIFDGLGSKTFRETVEGFASFFRAHSCRGLRIEEDDEKVTLVLDPCGSGGRMVQEGHFEAPKNLLRIKKAQAITFFREDFPSYCSHCAVFHHMMPIEWSGRPFPPIELGKGPGDPCKWHVYKDQTKIPERYYEQVGK